MSNRLDAYRRAVRSGDFDEFSETGQYLGTMPTLAECERAMVETQHLDPPAPPVRCQTAHFDIESGKQCPRCLKVVHRDHLGREINNPEKVIPRLSHACQYTNCNHCSGCPHSCHNRVPIHLDNPAYSAPGEDPL